MRSLATAEVLSPGPMTIEQWADMDEDEPGELVDGLLVEEEVPDHLHEAVVAWILATLHGWGSQRRAVVFGSEHKIAVSRTRGRKPDVTMYPPGTRMGHGSYSSKAPLLIVEVLSPRPRDTRRDRREKLKEYARFGVNLYMIVDPRAQLVELFERGENGRYSLVTPADENKLTPPGCEGLVLNLEALWAEAAWVIGEEIEEDQADSNTEPSDPTP